MKIFKGKAFFFKSVIFHILLMLVISFISISFWENPVCDTIINTSQIFSPKYGSDDVVLVMIDDNSTKEYKWPWQRELYAEIFDYFNKYTKTKVILFDILIRSSDKANPESDKKFFNSISQSKNIINGVRIDSAEYEPYIKEYDNKFYNKFRTDIINNSGYNFTNNRYRSISVFPDEYFNAVKNVGTVNIISSVTDGKYRKAYDIVPYKGIFYPSLTLKAYMKMNNLDKLSIDKEFIKSENNLNIPIKIDNSSIQHNIKFYKIRPNSKYSHKAYSAIDIIKSKRLLDKGLKPIITPEEFNNKVIIIGANALNVEDALNTTVSRAHPGPDVQATIIDNFIHNEYLFSSSAGLNIFIILIMCILTFSIIRLLDIIPSLFTLATISMIYVALCFIAINNNYVPLVVTPIALQVSTMIYGYSYRFILEDKNKEKIKNAMGKYLSQDIMKNVVQNIDDIKLGGKKANLTVLFSDIRGFTSMSENMTAEEVSLILNEYFSEMEPIISKYNGVINKFIGDAVMAIFGEPIQDINHAQNAVKCAFEMLKKVEQLRNKWLSEGKPKIEIGVGINTGEAFVGNIGSEKRLEYTVIGDTVNLASRIEGYNKVYKTNLLISSSTYSNVSDIVDVIKIADVVIRGKSKKMDIYEVLRITDCENKIDR